MDQLQLYNSEYRLMSIVWAHEPVNSTELTKLCHSELGWKKSTTYTMIRKLSERGLLQNCDATVTSLVGREQVRQYESAALLEKSFDGSLPLLFATFLQGRRLTRKDAEELKRMIEEAAK